MLLSFLTLIYLVIFKPMIGKIDFLFEVYNETMIYFITVFSYTFSDYLDDPILRYEIGFLLVGFVLLTMLLNWISLLIQTIVFIVQYVKKLVGNLKQEKIKSIIAGRQINYLKNLFLNGSKKRNKPVDKNFTKDLRKIRNLRT